MMALCKWWFCFLLCAIIRPAKTGENAQVNNTQMENSSKTDNKNSELAKQVETSLLSFLGLKRKPDVDISNMKVPSYMIHLYNIRSSDAVEDPDDEDRSANMITWDDDFPYDTVRGYYNKLHDDTLLTPEHSMLLHFNVSGIPPNEILRAVQLRISYERHYNTPIPDPLPNQCDGKRKWSSKDLEYLQRIRVYDVIRPARGFSGAVHRLLDTNVIDIRTNGTVAFDVASALQRWLKRPRTNYGIFFELSPLKGGNKKNNTVHIRLKRSVSDMQKSEHLLLVRTGESEYKPRIKRSVGLDKIRKTCQRHRMYVDFRKVEWSNWIVAPAGYDAFFCHGECPYPLADHMNSTNHAVVQTLVHSRYPSRVPTACCVPTEHSAISMLYVDEDGRVVLKTYQNMVVETCGCR